MFFIAIAGTSVTLALISYWLLLQANKRFWNKKIIINGARALVILSVLSSLVWQIGRITNLSYVSAMGAASTSMSLVFNALLGISLIVSILFEFINKQKNKSMGKDIGPSRRLFLKTTVASFPALAMGGTATGLASSFSSVRFPIVEVTYPELPDALDGFRILHLSDLHLGYFFKLDDLEKTLIGAEKFNVDMVVLTGDIVDNIWKLTETTRLIDQLKAPYGKFISVGNHEYYRSIRRVLIYIEKGPLPLLYNTHHIVDIKGIKMLVGGADDPVYSDKEMLTFLDNSISETLKNAPRTDFRLLMSHRPRALDLAQKYNIDLTLSGHTHGGQVGWGGKSFWETFNENGYLWGLYQKGNSKLYTSSGMGHWFPFRLNCPPEAPVIILKKTEPASI